MNYSLFAGDSDDDSSRDRHPSENSSPIDIPLSIQLTNTSGAIAMATPPRFYNSQLHSRTDDSPSASSVVMAGLHSPGRWSVMATRFNSPAESLRNLWKSPSTTVSQSHPGWWSYSIFFLKKKEWKNSFWTSNFKKIMKELILNIKFLNIFLFTTSFRCYIWCSFYSERVAKKPHLVNCLCMSCCCYSVSFQGTKHKCSHTFLL